MIKDKYENITSPQQLAGKILQTVLEPMAARAGLQSAAIYGITAITGIGMIPVAAGAILFGKDHALAELDQDSQAVYDACTATLRKLGEVSKENKENGIIKGKASGCSISIELTKTKQNKTKQNKTQVKVKVKVKCLSVVWIRRTTCLKFLEYWS
ncbi:MAG: DUF3568 domain-containing protein [Candidatus Scalindua sp.]|nr:DUF3568 domain-containing protein [Candidatus Scalindua sp.]MCR4343265.1 DUF3568 domain-containing protein [Candidatus Scalindua sp.]